MQQTSPDLPTPPAPPTPFVVRMSGGSPVSVYEGLTAQREVLGQQLEHLQDERHSLTERLAEQPAAGADRAGIEARIASIDTRIASMDKQIAAADAQVAQAAAVPGAVSGHEDLERQRRASERHGPPDEVFFLGGMFMVIVFLPLSVAFARRIWRRGASAVSALPGDLMERMSRLDQAVESIAIEVERIGEGQRFMTRVLTDSNGRALGGGPAEPVRVPLRDGVPVRSETAR